MKTTMLSRLEQIFICCLLAIAFAACKKSGGSGFTPPPPPPPITACKLIDETKSFVGTYEHYWYTYRSNGKLDSIYFAQSPGVGAIASCSEDVDGFLWISLAGTDGVTPNKYDYLYNSDPQDSTNLPTSLATSFTLFDGIDNPGYGYNFQYKASGKLDGYQETAPFVTGLLYGLGVEYDDNGDISTMVYNVTTGPRASSTMTASGYDGHPSPYTGIAGWVFLTPETGWTSSEYEPLFYALSPHNPTGSQINFGTDIWKDAMVYEYNAEGYPTKRTVTRTAPDGSTTTITHTYAYHCE